MSRRLVMALSFILFAAWAIPAQAEGDKFVKLLLKKGDKSFDERATKGKAEKARESYEKVLAVDSNNVEARWKLARTLYWLGTHVDSKAEKMKLFETGIRYCQDAVKLDDKCVPCQFWLGVSYSKFGEAKGVLQSLGLVPYAREAMEKVKAMDEKYEAGGAYRVLGRIYNKLPGLKGGDNTKSIEYLKKAVKIGPKNLMNHRFLAEVLLDEGKKDEAKTVLEGIINTPDSDLLKAKIPEMKEERELAKKIYEKNFK